MTHNLPTILSEIDSIEQVMRDSPRAYFKDEAMQLQYRSLITQKTGPTLLDESAEPLLPVASIKEYAAATGTTAGFNEYLKMMRVAADWTFAIPQDEQRAFVESMEALPQDVIDAAIEEVMSHPPHVNPSSDIALANFATMPEGAALMREWQHLSGRNLARVRERLLRMIDNMEQRSVPIFARWLDGLSVNSAVALYRKLAA